MRKINTHSDVAKFFLGVTTIGAHHLVASVTGVMMFCFCRSSNSAFSFSRYAKGMVHGVLTWNGFALSVRWIKNCSPSIVLMFPSNTFGNSGIICSLVIGICRFT